jgi:hypothetical protein
LFYNERRQFSFNKYAVTSITNMLIKLLWIFPELKRMFSFWFLWVETHVRILIFVSQSICSAIHALLMAPFACHSWLKFTKFMCLVDAIDNHTSDAYMFHFCYMYVLRHTDLLIWWCSCLYDSSKTTAFSEAGAAYPSMTIVFTTSCQCKWACTRKLTYHNTKLKTWSHVIRQKHKNRSVHLNRGRTKVIQY